MAADFKIGDSVRLSTYIPEGPVKALSVDQAGNIRYLVSWVDVDKVSHERWFNEDDLVKV
jgi:hypothetical protein